MSNEQKIVMVPRKLAEELLCLDHGCSMDGVTIYDDCTEDLRAILDAPSEHHPGEPVALPEHTQYLSGVTPSNAAEANAYKDGWNACLDEIAKLGPLYTNPAPAVQKVEPVAYAVFTDNGNIRIWSTNCEAVGIKVMQEEGKQAVPLYTHADAGEVEWLRLLNRDAMAELEDRKREIYALRSQLAEREARLREIASIPGDSINYHATHMSRIARASLSARAEPSVPKCTNCGASTGQACNDKGCGYLESGNGEPIEIDEQAAFMAWANEEYEVDADEELNLKNPSVRDNKIGWLARATLHRK